MTGQQLKNSILQMAVQGKLVRRIRMMSQPLFSWRVLEPRKNN